VEERPVNFKRHDVPAAARDRMRLLSRNLVGPVLRWMGASYDSPSVMAEMVTIAYVESDCRYRKQIKGPARSFWQIEPFTGLDFLNRSARLQYFWKQLRLPRPLTMQGVGDQLYKDDRAGCVMARVILWERLSKTAPPPFDPGEAAAKEGLDQYLKAWRPGRPHPERFLAAWPIAVMLVRETPE
jgi:hypothetical protein